MAMSVSSVRSLGVVLIVTSILVLYGIVFRWEEASGDSRSHVPGVPKGHPSVSRGDKCPLGYTIDDDDTNDGDDL